MALVVGACGTAASPSPSAPASAAPTASAAASASASAEASASASAAATALPVDPSRGGHPGRRAGAEIELLDVLPVAHLRPVHQGHDRPLRGDLSGRQGQRGKTTRARSRTTSTTRSPRATRRTSSTSRSARAGSASTRARACCSASTRRSRRPVKDIYFPGLWNAAARRRRELPVPVVPGPQRRADQQGHLRGRRRRRSPPTSPRPSTGCRPSARRSSTRPHALCAIRLTVNDLLAQMVYEGNVKVIGRRRQDLHLQLARGRGVAADVRRHGHRRDASTPTVLSGDDRVGLNAFSAGAAPFYATGPEPGPPGQGHQRHPVRQPRHGPLAARQVRRRGQGPDVDLGQEGHQVPERVHRARAVLHEPAEHGRVRQAGRGLPVVAVGVRRPVLLDPGHRRSRTAPAALAKDTVATYQDIVPTVPNKADVNDIVRKAIESALFNKVARAGRPSTEAVADANKLIK